MDHMEMVERSKKEEFSSDDAQVVDFQITIQLDSVLYKFIIQQQDPEEKPTAVPYGIYERLDDDEFEQVASFPDLEDSDIPLEVKGRLCDALGYETIEAIHRVIPGK